MCLVSRIPLDRHSVMRCTDPNVHNSRFRYPVIIVFELQQRGVNRMKADSVAERNEVRTLKCKIAGIRDDELTSQVASSRFERAGRQGGPGRRAEENLSELISSLSWLSLRK